MTSTPVVGVMRVSRTFGDLNVLDNVDFAVAPGEIHGLIGPNGVGKTTLLRIAAGLVDPTEGTVKVLGGDPAQDAIRTQIGWIPGGDRTFYLRLSGAANLEFFGRMYGMTRTDARARAQQLLAEVGLGDVGPRPAGLFSKGMLKRLSVARALLPEPRLLLCDETTHDLDPDGAESIRTMISTLASSGTAVLWATQRLDELAGFADSVTVLSRHGTAFDGSMEDLLVQLPRRSFRIQTGLTDPSSTGVVLDAMSSIEWAVDQDGLVVHVGVDTTVGDVIAALVDAGVPVVSVNDAGSAVEAAYRHVLGGLR